MIKPQGGLGRGLGALIPSKIAPEPGTEAAKAASIGVSQVPIDSIVENPHQPRKVFASADLEDLLSSIKEHGIIVPLIVTERGVGKYELIAGERRFRAAKMLGLKEVPAVVRTATEQQKLELALIENIQRKNLNPVEEAQAYQALSDQFSLKQEEIGVRVGKSRSHVANAMRLLELDEVILQALSDEKISRSHARTLLAEPDPTRRLQLFKEMLEGKMTVRQAEAKAGSAVRQQKAVDPNMAAIEAGLREALGTKVQLQMKGAAGKISIHFYSKEELKSLVKKLTE